MADDDFRSQRSRDAVAPRGAEVARGQLDDPLAELARLIGQSDPAADFGRDARREPPLEEPGGGHDWAADARYAEEDERTEESYGYNGRYEPRLAEPASSYRPIAGSRDDFEAEPGGQFSAPAPRSDTSRDGTRYRDREGGERLPAFLPRARAGRYDYDNEAQDDDRAYALEDYEEAPEGRRRGGFVVVAAVLGLAVLGTAGAFAYRAMFGASMLPTLPPIIKADNGPTKIVPPPNPAKAGASGQADTGRSDSGEKLVSREEQPVEMPVPVNPAPRVVSTIPIFPDPNQGGALASGAPPYPAAPAPAPAAPPAPPPGPAVVAAPAPAAAAPAAQGAPGLLPEPKKIHTVAIRPDQLAGSNAAPIPPPPPALATPPAAAPPTPATPAPARAAAPAPRPTASPAPRPAPAPPSGANAPLSIVPGQDGALPPPPRARTALAQTPAEIAPAGGGYAVQVSSQRSEAEAQTAFRALQAKFPKELGGRAPIVRRADLGAKGVFYRALVGPFASMEQAAQMCSSLKAAGGSCIVQHD